MKYVSTRGGISPTSYEETLFSGYAPDGGLYMPETIPKLTDLNIEQWKRDKLTYPQVVEKIVRLFVTEEEITDQDLTDAVERAYEKFSVAEKVGFKDLKSPNGKSFVLAQLYHGRTASFKDYALSLAGQFIDHFSKKRKTRTVILVGTSGDTGSAAMDAVKGLKLVDIVVLFPKGKISEVQELQMTSYLDKNIHVYAVEGSSDDLDVPIKECFPQHNVTSINSISWTRVMIQIAHYVYFYLREGNEIDVFVPTGAAGNITAGIIARLLGIPINLFCATNINDNVEIFFNSGVYEMGGNVEETPANAMDIRYPYNVERIFYLFTDAETTLNIVTKDKSHISAATKSKISNSVNGSFKAETSLIFDTLKRTWEQNHFMICPHTATAVAYYDRCSSPVGKNVYIIATASPLKFPESVEKSGISSDLWNAYELRDKLQSTPKIIPEVMRKGTDWRQTLQTKIDEILNRSQQE
ncbi:hypothetical protein HA402_016095 [Bradysia odoriphaga]|nr:hypothetical protein HA402_016095 [Bradysia odoriphaga]